MKHYFEPYSNVDWASLVVRAPVSGVVVLSAPESIINGKPSGNQVWIASEADPFLQVVLFHVTLLPEIERGTAVTAGQQIGTHIGTVTTSDIAVQQVSEQGLRYVSAFDVLTEQAFSEFQSRGIADRQAPQITADYRLAHRLTCQGEEFVGANDNPADWITLN